jgi:hypothetical protein
MGEAKRRRSLGRRELLEEATRRICEEGQGVYQLSLVSALGAAPLFAQAISGDSQAAYHLLIVARLLEQIRTAPPRSKLMCLLCDNEFSAAALPLAFVIMHARRDDPGMVMGNGICCRCCDASDLQARILDKYREGLISDLRVLPPIGEAGTA